MLAYRNGKACQRRRDLSSEQGREVEPIEPVHKDWSGHSANHDGLTFLHAASAGISENQQSVSHRKLGERGLHWISC